MDIGRPRAPMARACVRLARSLSAAWPGVRHQVGVLLALRVSVWRASRRCGLELEHARAAVEYETGERGRRGGRGVEDES